jgi:myxalamid-type polyketide synthase MxaE and MxaD
MNIASTLAHGRRTFPDRPAIVFDGETISYADLDRAACRAANALRGLGIGPGDRVALLLPNVPAFAYAYFGALKLGAIVVSINTGLTAEDVRFTINDSGAKALIVSDTLRHGESWSRDRVPSLAHVLVSGGDHASFEWEMARASSEADTRDMAASDPAVIVYTSGTTGVPKGATLSHGNVTFAMAAKQRYLDIRPDDRLLLFLPLYHCFGQNAILNAGLQAGATIVLQRGFDAGRVLEAVTRDRVTMVFGVPATFIVLQDRADARDLGLVRYCFSAAAPLPVHVEMAWREKFGLVIHQGYGLTETSPFASYNHAAHHRPGSIGTPIDEVEMDIVDIQTRRPVAAGEIGEIIIRGPNVMLGYWNRPADTAEAIQDGWFRTGDLGRRDDDGYFVIEDRLKDMAIVGGSNVYPAEVERVLVQHPAVADVAVYGVPDPVLGERVRAAIVLAARGTAHDAGAREANGESMTLSAAGAARPSEADIIAWCRGRLAAFKTPAAVDFVDELPRNRTGKVLKRVLRERHVAAQPAHAPAATAAHAGVGAGADAGASVGARTGADPNVRSLDATSPEAAHRAAYEADRIQRWIASRLDATLDLRGEPLDLDRPFVEYGATSIDAVELASGLEQWLGRPVPPTIVWHFPTLRTLARHLTSTTVTVPNGGAAAAAGSGAATGTANGAGEGEPIAIVGMGCRYPGADGLDAFWDLLRHGRDAVTEVPASRWDVDAFYDPDPAAPGKMASRWAGVIDRLDEFDAAFFGISPREAPHVDPRQRLALEVAWEALEDAKIPPDSLAGTRTGVFMATLTNDYDHLLFNDLHRADAYSGAGTANSIVANRISYFLDLRGPSLALDTACSGSLIAVHLACESLRRGESTLALAGGVNVNLMPKSNVFFSKAGALSPNGRCRTFDRSADGMVRSDGAGIVVLKTLSQAQRDGDRIVALIKGTAVNHDGRSNGLMAPNGDAQQAVLTEAYRRAGVAPADVQYIEAHGTGTRLGDPIEVQALGAVLTPERPADRRCLLGSVKTNIGHSEAAAAIAGVIKTALAMQHRVIPPTLHFTEPNPLIAFDRLPFDVPGAASPWPSPDAPLIAGISGFGFGGANAHLVLQEAPPAAMSVTTTALAAASGAPAGAAIAPVAAAKADAGSPSTAWSAAVSAVAAAGSVGPEAAPRPAEAIVPPFVLPVSARTPQALHALARAYRDRLAADAGDREGAAHASEAAVAGVGLAAGGAASAAPTADAAHALDVAHAGAICAAAATGRMHHAHRMAFVASSREELAAKLDRWLIDAPSASAVPLAQTQVHARDGGRLVFVFSGQGSHWPRMASDLYAREPRFKAAFDECDRLFARHAGWSLVEEIDREAAQSRLDDTELTQPAIFAVQWALFTLWRSFGIAPDAVVGHSLGEVAAACAAGAITLADGVRIVFHRSRLMKRASGHGRTAVVGLSFDEARDAIRGYEPALAVAGSNSPSASVVAGDPASIERLLADLSARDVFCRAIPGVDIAFHSPQMDPLRKELVQALAGLTPTPPAIPILSTVTGTFALPGGALGATGTNGTNGAHGENRATSATSAAGAADAGREADANAPAFDAAYWGRNLREPFLFAPAIERLLADGCRAFVEVSPHTVLSSSITQCIRHAGVGPATAARVDGSRIGTAAGTIAAATAGAGVGTSGMAAGMTAGTAAGAGVVAASRVVPVLCSMRKGERGRATLLEQLALLYERGESVDWTGVYRGRVRASAVALPTYAWQRQRFWFDQLPASPTVAAASAGAGVGERKAGAHPLLGERIEPAAHAADRADRFCLWEMDFDAAHPAYFADHRVLDEVIVPGAALLEMAMASARQVWGDRSMAVCDVLFEQALRLTDAPRRVQASLSVRGNAAEFQVHSRPAHDPFAHVGLGNGGPVNGGPVNGGPAHNGPANDGPAHDRPVQGGAAPLAWTRHVTGRVELMAEDDVEPADVSLAAIAARCADDITPEQHYDMMASGGLAYGPAFRGVRQLSAGPREAFADLRLPSTLADPRYAVHPAMLDAALQVVAAAVGSDDENSYLPRGVARWRVFRPTSDRVWCHARLTPPPAVASSPSGPLSDQPSSDRPSSDPSSPRRTSGDMRSPGASPNGGHGELQADIDLVDESGRVVARLEGLALMRVGARRRNPLEDSLIEERWEPRRLAAVRPDAAAASPARATTAQEAAAAGAVGTGANAPTVVAAWLVLSDAMVVGDLVASTLRARGHEVTVVRPGTAYRRVDAGQVEVRVDRPEDMARLVADAGRIDGVAHLWSLNTRQPDDALEALDAAAALACGSALHLTQALVAAGSAARLWLVTSRALAADDGPLDVQQAPLAGLALVIAQEHPELRCTSVDLDADDAVSQAAHLVDEFLAGHDETRIAWRARTRSVSRIVPMTLASDSRTSATLASAASASASANAIRLRGDATYLITGGLGALGLRTAAAFAARGAGHLVLTGRSGRAGKAAASAIESIERRGTTVTIVAADVADPMDVDRLFTTVLAGLPPLAGVVHAAGVLNDALIAQQSLDHLRTAMAPKVRGAWNLHLHTRERALEFFVCYSSAASLVGSPGQGNYAAGNAFMDALAHHRRALGLPATSINWGAWEEEGMAATAQMRSRLEARGVGSIKPRDGIAVLCRLLASGTPRAAIGVMPVDWTRFLRQFPAGVPARFEALAAAADAAAAVGSTEAGASGAPGAPRTMPRDLWRSAPRGERVAVLRRCVSRELAAVLGFDASAEIAPRERYFDLGMDSLMAVEFKNRLQQAFGVALPATLAFEHPTIDALTQLLDESLALQEGDGLTMEPSSSSSSSSSSHATSEADAEAARGAAAADADLDALSTDEIARLLASELAGELATRPRDEAPRGMPDARANEPTAGSPNQRREEAVRVR